MQNKLEKIICSILHSSLQKSFVLFVTAALFFGSIYLLPLEVVKAKMLPNKDSDVFSVYVDLPFGSSKTMTQEVVECISQNLQKNENVISVSAFLGEGQPLDFAGMVKMSVLKNGEHEAEMMVNIKKKAQREELSYNLISKIRPSLQKECSLYDANIKLIELPAGPPVLSSIVAQIYGGNSLESQRQFAIKIADTLRKQDKLVDIDILAQEPFLDIRLVLNENKILNSAIELDWVKKTLYLAFEGMIIGAVNEKDAENQIPIFLRLDDSRKLQTADKIGIAQKLNMVKIMNKTGLLVPLGELVDIQEELKDPFIASKDLNKIINVIAETDNESQIYPLLDARGELMQVLANQYEIEKTDLLNLSFTDKQTNEVFKLVWDGELKVTIDTFIDLGGAFIGALVLIFLLMVVYYQSFLLAGGIVLASFLSLFGVIFGHLIMNIFTQDQFYLTATSLIGYIGLIGINSRNSLLIIDFSRQLMREKGFEAKKAVCVATATRAKPILLTVLAIIFASSLLATDAVFGGLGVALIGGTLAAYFVSIFFVPITIVGALEKIESKNRQQNHRITE